MQSKISEDKDQISMEGDTARELVDNTTNYKRTQTNPSAKKNARCTTRVLLGLTIFFFLTTVGILAVLLWRELIYNRPAETLKESVLKKFPGFYRTQDEQELFDMTIINLDTSEPILVNQSIYDSGYRGCSIDCAGGGQPVRKAEQTYAPGSIFHGCCVSNTYFASPDTKKNIFGITKTLAHYTDMRQYFQATNCSLIVGCTGCTCMQDRSVQTAVVLAEGVTSPDHIEDSEIHFFYFEGCCSCRNT